MKKQYNKPEMSVIDIETECMLESSLHQDYATDTGKQYSRRSSRQNSRWDFDDYDD